MAINFGKQMKAIREQNGWTLEEMAEKLGTTKQALSKYERGERTPKITVASEFAEKLGVDLRVFIGEDAPMQMELVSSKEKQKEVPITQEARILAKGIDKLPKKQREQALSVVRAMFEKYADYFTKEEDDEP